MQHRPPLSDNTLVWLNDLLNQEIALARGERTELDFQQARQTVEAHETAQFLRKVYECFGAIVDRCNEKSVRGQPRFYLEYHDGSPATRLILARGAKRVTLESPKSGVILLKTEKSLGVGYATLSTGVIESTFEPFDELAWKFVGAMVIAEQVARQAFKELLQS